MNEFASEKNVRGTTRLMNIHPSLPNMQAVSGDRIGGHIWIA